MVSKPYARKLAEGHRAGEAGKPVIVPDNTLYLHGPAKIIVDKDEHPIRYELATARYCKLVPSTLILRGPENVLREASRDDVILEIDGEPFKTPVVLYSASDFLAVDAEPFFRLIVRAMRLM
jgi:hypothetical protein